MRLCYTERAKHELETAFQWYENQLQGLGFEFLDCVEEVMDTIQKFPNMYPEHHECFRRALMQRFPFSIFYTIEVKEIIVHAVFDNRQDPNCLP